MLPNRGRDAQARCLVRHTLSVLVHILPLHMDTTCTLNGLAFPPITHSLFDLCTRERLLTLRDLKVNVRIYKDKNGLKLASYYVQYVSLDAFR